MATIRKYLFKWPVGVAGRGGTGLCLCSWCCSKVNWASTGWRQAKRLSCREKGCHCIVPWPGSGHGDEKKLDWNEIVRSFVCTGGWNEQITRKLTYSCLKRQLRVDVNEFRNSPNVNCSSVHLDTSQFTTLKSGLLIQDSSLGISLIGIYLKCKLHDDANTLKAIALFVNLFLTPVVQETVLQCCYASVFCRMTSHPNWPCECSLQLLW